MANTRRRILGAAAFAALPGIDATASAPFRMAYFETYSPLSYRDNGGALKGILVDVLEEVLGKRMGVAIQHLGYPWVRAQQLAKVGEVDAICTIATAARQEYAVASSESVVTAARRIFVRADSPLLAGLQQVQNLEDLRKLNPVVVSYVGNGWVPEHLGGFKVVQGADFESGLKMLIARRGDIMIDNSLTMQFSLRRLPGGDQMMMMPAYLDASNFQLLISKLSPHTGLLPEFDRTLAQYKKTSAYAEVLRRYGVSG